MIVAGIAKLKQKYTEAFCEVLKMMMRFSENDRPSFIELAKILVAKQLGAINS